MTKTTKQKLNSLRYHYFLDSSFGINRELFEKSMEYTVKSILNWQSDLSKEERNELNKNYLEEVINQYKTSDELDLIFEKRKEKYLESGVPKTVPRKVTPQEARKRIIDSSKQDLPKESRELHEILNDIDNQTTPSIRFNEHFMGEQHPYGLIVAITSGYLGLCLNENAIAQKVSPSTSILEQRTTNMLANLVGRVNGGSYTIKDELSEEELEKLSLIPKGSIVGGGTIANLTALLVARNKALYHELSASEKEDLTELINNDFEKYGEYNDLVKEESSGVGVAEIGLKQYLNPTEMDDFYWLLKDKKQEDLIVITSEQSHYSIEKLVGFIGIGNQNCWKVKTNKDNKINLDHLNELIEKSKKENKKVISIVATAGTSGTGAIDPLKEIGKIAKENNIYFHVDAAHGGGFLAAPSFRKKFEGIEDADSVTMDGHKMFYTHYSCGGIIFKDKTDPAKFLKQSADYILNDKEEHYNSGKSTVEGSRGVGGILQLYAAINSLGEEGYDVILNHVHEMTNYLGELADNNENIEKMHNPELNMVNIRYVPSDLDKTKDYELINKVNENLNELIYQDGEFYIGNNSLIRDGHKVKVQRAIIVNPYIEKETIEKLVDKIETLGPIAYNQIKEEI